MMPSSIGEKLDRIRDAGVSHIVSYIPWQSVESDISHHLSRFVQAVSERKMSLSLVVTPELGVHFASSGLPKDLLSKSDLVAHHFERAPIQVTLAPNSFLLPSLLSPEFSKRYFGFLTRIDTLLADIEKAMNRPLENVTLLESGSFWKSYRSPAASSSSKGAFGASAGDYSKSASNQFRLRIEDYYSQPEFNDPSPQDGRRWTSQAMEDVNRRWFYQASEAGFRARIPQLVKRRAVGTKLASVEIFTPEADPSLAYSFFLSAISGNEADFHRLSSLIDEAAIVMSGASSHAPSWLHWTAFGGYRSLSPAQKRFLITKSLLLLGSQGGGVLLDEEEWFSLSKSFRKKMESLAQSMEAGSLKLAATAGYLCPHLWSGPGAFWNALVAKSGFLVRRLSSLELLEQDQSQLRFLMVDPAFVLTREALRKLLSWASKPGHAGTKILALPRGAATTTMARAWLDQIAQQAGKKVDVNLGTRYQVIPFGSDQQARIVLYDVPDAALTQEMNSPEWQTFVDSLVLLAEIAPVCRSSDTRMSLIPLERPDRSLALFVLNGTRRAVQADVIFPVDVQMGDLDSGSFASAHSSQRFTLEVPACGVLPFAVDRVGGMTHHVVADAVSGLKLEQEAPGEISAWN